MAKEVIGIYKTEEEVKEAVENLEQEGYKPADVLLLTNDVDATKWLRDETEAKVDTADGHQIQDPDKDASFWEKVKEAAKGNTSFHGKDIDNAGKSLVEYGLPPEEADVYKAEIQEGKVLVLVEADARPQK